MPNGQPDPTQPKLTKTDAMNNFWDRIANFFTDIATLDVVTLSGNVQFETIKGDANAFQLDNSFKELMNAGGNNLNLIAFSHYEFDQDAVLYVKENMNEGEQALFNMHQETVKTAQEVRQNVVNLVMNSLGVKGLGS